MGGGRTSCVSLKQMTRWAPGYAEADLNAAQERYGVRFPPDLVEIFLERRPTAGYDWRHDEACIQEAFRAPADGLLFDIEHNDLWWPEWGDRPLKATERAEVLASVLASAPRLIPIIGHRYIPEQPHAAGNPIFSVMQSDVIYYGANLDDYFRREFSSSLSLGSVGTDVRVIPFWSELVVRNV